MCGIGGVIFHGKEHLKRDSDDWAMLICMLAAHASIRGTDATGLARMESDGYKVVYKNTVPAHRVINFKRWQKPLLNIGPNTTAVMIHTRYGTHGENTIANAHPFHYPEKDLVGTHNGVISNYTMFGPPGKPFDNDSANLFYGLASVGRTQWPSMLEEVRGSFALAFMHDTSFFIVRNSSSPCVTAPLLELNATIYASTESILLDAAKDGDFKIGPVHHVPVGGLYEWVPGNPVPTVTEIKLYSYNSPYTVIRHRNYIDDDDDMAPWGPSYGQKQLPPAKYRCEACTTEVKEITQCSEGEHAGKYICWNCSDSAPQSGQCEWCKEVKSVSIATDLNMFLCESCHLYNGSTSTVASRAEDNTVTVECEICTLSQELGAGTIEDVMVWSPDTDGWVCSTCVQYLEGTSEQISRGSNHA